MPNIYIKPEKRAALAVASLHQQSRYGGLVTRFDGNAFVGARNDTLYYETDGVTIARDYEFRKRTNPVIFDEIYKTRLQITLDQHMTQGVKFTDEEEKFDLESYQREILRPQVQAIARKFDAKIATALTNYTGFKTTNHSIAPGTDVEGKSALREALKLKAKADADGVPAGRRILLAGANVFAWFAASSAVVTYDPAAAKTVFREGLFGRIAGMDLFDASQLLGENEFIVLDPSWAVLANASPMVPAGIPWGARSTYEGWSLRVIRAYDVSYATERSLVNTFWGLNPIADEFQRHTAATAATAADGSEKGDVVIVDGAPVLTGKNVRGLRGTFTPPTP